MLLQFPFCKVTVTPWNIRTALPVVSQCLRSEAQACLCELPRSAVIRAACGSAERATVRCRAPEAPPARPGRGCVGGLPDLPVGPRKASLCPGASCDSGCVPVSPRAVLPPAHAACRSGPGEPLDPTPRNVADTLAWRSCPRYFRVYHAHFFLHYFLWERKKCPFCYELFTV